MSLNNCINRNGILVQKGVTHLFVDVTECNSEFVMYEVKKTPICQFDQHSRARVGVEFSDYKVDVEPYYAVYTKVFDMMASDRKFEDKVFETLAKIEIARLGAQNKAEFNLMSRCCSYKVKQTWQSLKGQMARRLKFCEEEFIVGLHWLLREKLIGRTELVTDFVPSCDFTEHCDYSKDYYLSQMFGCLFAPCGRWPAGTEYATFNESCSDLDTIASQLGIPIPYSTYGEK